MILRDTALKAINELNKTVCAGCFFIHWFPLQMSLQGEMRNTLLSQFLTLYCENNRLTIHCGGGENTHYCRL